MGIKCGIVGLPNVGKSTLFNALTRAQIAAENYPFCTIDPNVGIVPVPDPRLDALAEDRRTREDRADHGGVRRHRGPGGRRVAGRRPRQPVPVAHPRDRRDRARGALLRGRRHRARVGQRRIPSRDIEIIDTELALADLQSVEKAVDRNAKAGQGRRQGCHAQARPVRAHAQAPRRRQAGALAWACTKEEKADSQELHLLTASR